MPHNVSFQFAFLNFSPSAVSSCSSCLSLDLDLQFLKTSSQLRYKFLVVLYSSLGVLFASLAWSFCVELKNVQVNLPEVSYFAAVESVTLS